MAKTKGRKAPRIPQEYLDDLNKLTNLCFRRAIELELDDYKLATEAGLSRHTIYRLRECLTQIPQLLTIWKLCQALQLNMQFKVLEAKHKSSVAQQLVRA